MNDLMGVVPIPAQQAELMQEFSEQEIQVIQLNQRVRELTKEYNSGQASPELMQYLTDMSACLLLKIETIRSKKPSKAAA